VYESRCAFRRLNAVTAPLALCAVSSVHFSEPLSGSPKSIAPSVSIESIRAPIPAASRLHDTRQPRGRRVEPQSAARAISPERVLEANASPGTLMGTEDTIVSPASACWKTLNVIDAPILMSPCSLVQNLLTVPPSRRQSVDRYNVPYRRVIGFTDWFLVCTN